MFSQNNLEKLLNKWDFLSKGSAESFLICWMTHTALKYACPSLVIPHILDQFFWNKIILSQHLGPKGIPIKKLNEKNFENKLLDLLNNESYKRNTRLLSEKMKAESDKNKLYDLIINLGHLKLALAGMIPYNKKTPGIQRIGASKCRPTNVSFG